MKLFWKMSEILLRCLWFCSWPGHCHLTATKWKSSQDFWEGRNRQALKAEVNLLPLPVKVYTWDKNGCYGATHISRLEQETYRQPEPLGPKLSKHKGISFFQGILEELAAGSLVRGWLLTALCTGSVSTST